MTILTKMDVTDKIASGKGSARALRREGRVPAVLYGKNFPSLMFSVNARELWKEVKKGGFFSRLFTLTLQGKEHRAVVRDMQMHPVTDEPLHIDFVRVEKGSLVTVSVRVTFVDEDKCPGIKRGGVLNVVAHTIDLACPIDSIPDHIEFSLEGLDIHSSIHAHDLKLPDGVHASGSKDYTIATIVAPTLKADGAQESTSTAS